MGSKQSSLSNSAPGSFIGNSGSAAQEQPQTQASNPDARKTKTKLSGFALVQKQCRKHKRKYDKCYSSWYSGSFVSGKDVKSREESCDELFDEWRECILRGMNQDRQARGLGPPAEDSLLGEVEED